MNVFCPRNAFIVAGSNRKREVICHEIVKCLSPNCKKTKGPNNGWGMEPRTVKLQVFLSY